MSSISKSAISEANFNVPALFYNSAREGMQDFLEAVLRKDEGGVLLPAFIGWSPREGSGVFDPVRALGLVSGFYDLNPDLTVNLTSLESMLSSGRFRVLIVIHYFGRTEPKLQEIRQLADRYAVLLVEDPAHGYFSAEGEGQAGRHGEVCLFSLHKMFPIAGGGLVRYRDRTLVTSQMQTAPEYASKVMSYDWRAIAASRRENFVAITEWLFQLSECGDGFQLLWPELDPWDVPQTLPVRVLSDNRDAIYERMNAQGFGMVSLYHTLIDEIGDEFENMQELSNQIINFPVHQDVQLGSVEALVRGFRHGLAVR